MNDIRRELNHTGSRSKLDSVIKGLGVKRARVDGTDYNNGALTAAKEIINKLTDGLDEMEKEYERKAEKWEKYEVDIEI